VSAAANRLEIRAGRSRRPPGSGWRPRSARADDPPNAKKVPDTFCSPPFVLADDPPNAKKVPDTFCSLTPFVLAQEKPGQTLQATAFVHEAYLRLVDVEKAQHWDSRSHFFAAAAEAMRRILVEKSRHKRSRKGGGGLQRRPDGRLKLIDGHLRRDQIRKAVEPRRRGTSGACGQVGGALTCGWALVVERLCERVIVRIRSKAMSEKENPERPILEPPRVKGRNVLLVGASILVCLALAYDYFVIHSMEKAGQQDTLQEEIQQGNPEERLQEAIAEADRLDPGWRLAQSEEKRATIPDEQNSALVIMAAHNLLPANWPLWERPEAPENQNRSQEELRSLHAGLWDVEPPVQLNEDQTKALRQELRRAEEALTSARKVAALPKGRFPNTRGGSAVWISRLLYYDALLRAQDEDLDGALTSYRAVLNCCRSIDNRAGMGLPVNWLQMAIKMVERTLAQGELSEAALLSIQRDLEEEVEQLSLLTEAREKRRANDAWMQAVQNEETKPISPYIKMSLDPSELALVRRVIINLRPVLLKHNNRFVEFAKLPEEQQLARLKELQVAEADIHPLAPFEVRRMFAAPTVITAAFHRYQASLRSDFVMVSVERFRRAQGRWPDTLNDLVPSYLPKVPLDPFEGSPLRYRRLDDGVVVYSVGLDGRDNLDIDPRKDARDLGFRLWDVPKRRQPPKPAEIAPQRKDN
jgi:hypothetical protein